MPGFKRPAFPHAIDIDRERKALRAHKPTRALPQRQAGHLLLATWNIANLGAPEQEREPECFPLLAEIVSYFDLVAVQEIRDNVSAVRELLDALPSSWRLLFSEAGGNDERFGFYWDNDTVDPGQLVGKVTFEPKELARAGGTGFLGFSRAPYIGTFHSGSLQIELVSAHSFFGKAKNPLDMARRLAETKALGWWCQERSKDPDSYTKDILAVGDLNTPSEDDWPMAKQMLDDLPARGLHTPRWNKDGDETVLETQIGTAVRSENHYDHLLFFPTATEADLEQVGVFDLDAVIFHDLWQSKTPNEFNDYVIWAISDHRPLWAQLKAPT
jgi:endonuclease/exonuclease/phosphatase family metal-dependent hydrolase